MRLGQFDQPTDAIETTRPARLLGSRGARRCRCTSPGTHAPTRSCAALRAITEPDFRGLGSCAMAGQTANEGVKCCDRRRRVHCERVVGSTELVPLITVVRFTVDFRHEDAIAAPVYRICGLRDLLTVATRRLGVQLPIQ